MKDTTTKRTQYSVVDFVAWQREGSLQLNPNFQRRSVWKKGAKSYLIDTIVRGLPMPIIFLRDLGADLKTFKPKRDVVDGQQRLRTILAFIDPHLLPDFDPITDDFTISPTHNKQLGGLTYTQLDKEHKQRILDYQFSVHSFSADTDDREILQIFARMNSTGVKLNAQELRNAEWSGEFKTTAYDIATEQLNRWRDWQIFRPDQIARMNEVELSSEFMLLILGGILGKSNKIIDSFYKKYEEQFSDKDETVRRFRAVFESLESMLREELSSGLFGNRTLFYALFATIYGLQYGLREPSDKHSRLTRTKPNGIAPKVLDHIRKMGERISAGTNVPENVAKALRGATTDTGTRRIVIQFLAGKENDPCRAKS